MCIRDRQWQVDLFDLKSFNIIVFYGNVTCSHHGCQIDAAPFAMAPRHPAKFHGHLMKKLIENAIETSFGEGFGPWLPSKDTNRLKNVRNTIFYSNSSIIEFQRIRSLYFLKIFEFAWPLMSSLIWLIGSKTYTVLILGSTKFLLSFNEIGSKPRLKLFHIYAYLLQIQAFHSRITLPMAQLVRKLIQRHLACSPTVLLSFIKNQWTERLKLL